MLPNQLGQALGDAATGSALHARAKVLREANVFRQRLLVLRSGVAADVDIKDIELTAHRAGHPRTTGDQILCSRIRTDADGNTLAYSVRRLCPVLFQKSVQAAVDHAGDLAQRQFAQCDQVAGPKEMRESALGAVYGVDVAALHTLLQCLG